MRTAIFQAMLPEGVPEWVQLIPAGVFKAKDGRGPYKLTDPEAVIRASMTGDPRLAIDENHSIDIAVTTGQPSPARGWIVAMEVRSGSIWGKVEWTKAGAAMLSDRDYGGLSPVFMFGKDGTVERILRAGLTNNPALTQLERLHHSQETGMDLAAIRAALGLPDTADEAAIVAAATGARQGAAALVAEMGKFAVAAGLPATAPAEQVFKALETQRAGGTDIAKMTATIVGLETQVATMRKDQSSRDAVVFVDGAIKAGKPIVALRQHYIDRFVADRAAVETEVNAMISINAGGMVVPNAGSGGEGTSDADLTAEDKQVIARMNLDPAAFLAQKKKQAAPNDGRAA